MTEDSDVPGSGEIAQQLRSNLVNADIDPNEGGIEPGTSVDELMETVKIDALTKIHNRRYLAEYIDSVKDSEEDVTVFMLDMDHFKDVNDTYGHQVGDDTLIHIADMLREEFRTSDGDELVRYGGEEFCVIMKTGDRQIAAERAEKLRKKFEDEKFGASMEYRERTFKATGSIGISVGKANELVNLLGQADMALYAAKQGDGKENKGRNQWKFYTPDMGNSPRQGNAEET